MRVPPHPISLLSLIAPLPHQSCIIRFLLLCTPDILGGEELGLFIAGKCLREGAVGNKNTLSKIWGSLY